MSNQLPGEGEAPLPVLDPSELRLAPPDPKAPQPGTVALWTLIGAALLHLLIFAALEIDWPGHPVQMPKPIEVRLVQEPPAPPPPPKPKPAQPEKPKPPPPPPPPPPPTPPQPAPVKPRESGADETTEAKKTEEMKPALPQSQIQKAPEPEKPEAKPEPAPKPTPPRTTEKERASGRGEVLPLPPLPPVAQEKTREAAPAHHNLTIRLPAPGGGNGEQDRSGDPYLNHLRALFEKNRVYPETSEFHGAAEKQVIYSFVVNPNGNIDTIILGGSSGSSRIDEAARAIITNSMPFPPLPPDYDGLPTPITVIMSMIPHP